MTSRAIRRTRTVARMVLAALGAFAAARASPPAELAGMGKWDPRFGHRLESPRGLQASATSLNPSAALSRMEIKPSVSSEFYQGFLARRVSALFGDEKTVSAADLANPALRPWTGNRVTVQHIQNLGIRAIGEAFQRYATDRLGIDNWSFPMTRRSGDSEGAAGPPRTRLRFGFSHLAPRADLLIPVSSGQVVLGGDARGRIRATFEPKASSLRLAADVDVREHTATVGFDLRF